MQHRTKEELLSELARWSIARKQEAEGVRLLADQVLAATLTDNQLEYLDGFVDNLYCMVGELEDHPVQKDLLNPRLLDKLLKEADSEEPD